MQTIKETTRVGPAGGQIVHSTLDLHFTNVPDKIKGTTSEMCANSDHCYIEFQRSGVKDFRVPNQTRRRQWRKIDWNVARIQLRMLDMSDIYKTRDVNEVALRITAAICRTLDFQAPMKNFSNRKNFASHMDEELLEEVKKKKNLFKKLQKKRIYVGKQVENAKNSEDLWKISKQTLGWEKRERIRKMKVGDELIEDKKEIASNLNTFFVDKVKKISERIPETNTDPLNYTRMWTEQFVRIPEMRLRRVSMRTIKKTIRNLRNSKSCSHDDINTFAIKQLCNEIAPWMKRLVILSFEENKFPDPEEISWKKARIVCRCRWRKIRGNRDHCWSFSGVHRWTPALHHFLQ